MTAIEFELDGDGKRGPLTREIFFRARGRFRKIFSGWYRGGRVSVKILVSEPGIPAPQAHETFMAEVAALRAVRGIIDRAGKLLRIGAPLVEPCGVPNQDWCEPHDLRGWRHLVYVHGVGMVPDFADIASGLPSGPAHFVVMERLTGGSLSTMPRPISAVERAPAELSCALAALAAAHVVHGDIKPESIMMRTPDGELVLTDFGVNRVAHGEFDEMIYHGFSTGATFYVAPELLGDDSGCLAKTSASDVYVLGKGAEAIVRG